LKEDYQFNSIDRLLNRFKPETNLIDRRILYEITGQKDGQDVDMFTDPGDDEVYYSSDDLVTGNIEQVEEQNMRDMSIDQFNPKSN